MKTAVRSRAGSVLLAVGLVGVSSAVAGADWRAYPHTDPASEIRFPEDEGSHAPLLGLEWWYVVIHAQGLESGDEYAILVTHFNNEARFFTVANVTRGIHRSGTTLGVLRAEKGFLDLTQTTPYGTDILRTQRDPEGRLIPFAYQLETHHPDMQLRAELEASKKPAFPGRTGYVPIGSSGHSWYYSLPRLEVSAVLTFEGRTEPIRGLGWMDHQWGPFFVSPIEVPGVLETYEWFCLHLDNGADVMISNIYDRDYNLPQDESYGGVLYQGPDGDSLHTQARQFARTGFWQDPASGRFMSMGWTLRVPEWDLDLVLTPAFKEQMVDIPMGGDFWEGSISVSGTVGGRPVQGKAFGELIHRFEKPRLSVQVDPARITYRQDEKLRVSWRVKNPDQGNPLRFDVELISSEKSVPLASGLTATSLELALGEVLPKDHRIRKLQIRVSACSVDRTLCGSADSPALFLDTLWRAPFEDDGVVQPGGYFQRYRRAEYDRERPFFQWWYFAIKDLASNRYFALDYSLSDSAEDPTNEGSYVMFGMVDGNDQTRFHKYERYPLERFSVKNDFDLQIQADDGPDFSLEALDDDTYHLRGKMHHPQRVWVAEGCEPGLEIEWDLIVHRIYGWFGQQDIQQLTEAIGLINWNTYGHAAEVEGFIRVGETTHSFDRRPSFRAYCDQNWGESFPTGSPAIEYPWGWYHVGLPSADRAKELSIIAGIGRHDLTTKLKGASGASGLAVPGIGKFADIRLDASTHIGVRSLEGFGQNPQAPGIPLLASTNDGQVRQFKIERDDWAEFADAFGSAQIPLHQRVLIDTEHHLVALDYFSRLEDYNRLLFPHQDYVFSDFEALGVDVHVVVTHREVRTRYSWWDVLQLVPIHEEQRKTLFDFWSDDGGLEYGYQLPLAPLGR